MIFFIYFVFGVVYPALKEQNTEKIDVKDRCIQLSVLMGSILYVFSTKKAAEPIDCTRQPDGTFTMDADPATECHLDTDWVFYAAVGMIVFVFYGFIGPFILYKKLKNNIDLLDTESFQRRYGWLYMRFNSKHYYWEFVNTIRKMALVLISVFLTTRPETQVMLSIGVVAFFLLLHLCTKPYLCLRCRRDFEPVCKHFSANDRFEAGLMFIMIGIMIVGMISFNLDGTNDNVVIILMLALLIVFGLLFAVTMMKAYRDKGAEVIDAQDKNRQGNADLVNLAGRI